MTADDPAEQQSELVMPFLPVTSKGGTFPDDAYTAGYEMGLLDATLGHPHTSGFVERTLRVENRAQADLLAMRHGWSSSFADVGDGWIAAQFTRATENGPAA